MVDSDSKEIFVEETIEAIEFKEGGKTRTPGYIGKAKSDGKEKFVWNQTLIRQKSKDNPLKDAYGMSIPIIEELEERGIKDIYVSEAGTWITLEDVKDGELLEKDDPFFNEPREHDQRVVMVDW